jgi:hypothetical protein
MRPNAGLGAFILAVAIACRPQPAETSADARTPLALPVEASDAVRAEMRTMLGSIHGVLTALPGRDTAAMRAAAAASGMAAAADTALEHLLPEEFLTLGTATHQQFDSLGVAIGGGMRTDSVVARLGALMANCVSCHTKFRLVPAGAP